MKVDILSDFHLNFYFKPHLTRSENIISLFKDIFTDNNTREIGDVLNKNPTRQAYLAER